MNKVIIILAGLFLSISSFGQNDAIDRFFEQYQSDENFTMVYVSPKMFSMAAKVVGEEMDEELQTMVKSLKGLKVLKTNINAEAVYRDAIKKIPTNEYEILVTARDNGQNVKILTKAQGDEIIEEVLLLVGGEQEFVLVSFVGNINLNDLARIASKLDMDGVKHLEKIGN